MVTVTLTPEILNDPEVIQRVNDLPRMEIPVPYDEKYQDAKFEDATIRVWKDGEPQPVDTLVDVSLEEGGTEKRTILTAEGGDELKDRVTASVQFKDAHTFIENQVSQNTSYTVNVDNPATTTTTDVQMQSPDTSSEFSNVLPSIPADKPIHETGSGEIETHQTSFLTEGENGSATTGSGTGTVSGLSNASATEAEQVTGTGGNNNTSDQTGSYLRTTFTLDYDIPSGDPRLQFRVRPEDHTESPAFDLLLDGSVVQSNAEDVFGSNDWTWLSPTASTSLSAGTHSVQLSTTSATSNNKTIYVDIFGLRDDRYSYTVPADTNTDDYLDGPEDYPDAVQQEFQDAAALNQVVAGKLDVTIDDTSNKQALGISNDQGATFLTASNTTTVDKSFGSSSSQIRGRVTLSRFGSRSTASPATGFKPQTLDAYQLFSDQEDTPVLIDRSFDDRLINIIKTVAEDKNFVAEIRVDRDYNFSFEMAQLGQRQSDDTTVTTAYEVSKNTASVVEKAVIKGGRQSRRGEAFTSSHGSFVGLGKDDLVEGVEAVYDPNGGTQFERGTDYEMDYLAGSIKTLSTGAMSDATTYEINYSWRPQASYTASGVSSPKTIVRSVPSIVSDQTAEQLAYRTVTRFDSPVYEATVTVPDDVGWSVIDEINPDRVPTAGQFLQIQGVETTPDAVIFDLATQQTINEFLARFEDRLNRVQSRV